MLQVVLAEPLFPIPDEQKVECAVLRLLASGSANPAYIQVRLVTLTSVLQVNGDAARITDLPGLDIN